MLEARLSWTPTWRREIKLENNRPLFLRRLRHFSI